VAHGDYRQLTSDQYLYRFLRCRKGKYHRLLAGLTAPLLSERQKSANTTRSKVRARVEHVFGHQQSSMGGKIVRTIGMARARFKIGMMNLGYNIRRLVQLERVAAAPA
jgi:hypothetical protein